MRALTLLVAIALFGAGYYLLTPDGRELIDRITINVTRADYQAHFRAGQPLPGTPDLDRIDQRLAAHGVAQSIGDPGPEPRHRADAEPGGARQERARDPETE